jgi:hypothetical protein
LRGVSTIGYDDLCIDNGCGYFGDRFCGIAVLSGIPTKAGTRAPRSIGAGTQKPGGRQFRDRNKIGRKALFVTIAAAVFVGAPAAYFLPEFAKRHASALEEIGLRGLKPLLLPPELIKEKKEDKDSRERAGDPNDQRLI